MNYKNPESFCHQQFLEALDLIENRGHHYIDGAYERKTSQLIVYRHNDIRQF